MSIQNMNQFNMGAIKGSLASIPNPVTLSAQINPNSTDTLYPGSAVKLTSGVSSETVLVDLAAQADIAFGFVVWTPKKSSFTAGNAVEIALPNSVMNMESSGAIGRGNQVEFVPASTRVVQSSGTNKPSGIALDIATATGQLIRVLIKTGMEFSSSSSCRSSSSSSCRSSSSSSSST